MMRKKVLARTLSLAFGAAVVGGFIASPAMAQSNATGNILGHVESPAGASIVLINTDNGLKRTLTLDAKGRYLATAMPAGHYKVELLRDAKVVTSTEIDVIIGQGVEASFEAVVQSVNVTGRRSRIDVSNTNNGAVFTSKELKVLPIASNLTAVILLAPNTTRGDAAYGSNAISIGGGAASENAYYINGLPTTNPLSQLGSSELPFGAIAQAQVLTGGFGAEFGRSIGGVMSVTTKSGTNSWEAGATFSLTPNALRSKTKNIYYPVTGSADGVDGNLHYRQNTDTSDVAQTGVYVGGPLVTDKLFMFIAADKTETKSGQAIRGVDDPNVGRDGWRARKDGQTRYLAKFDWNLTDNHRLEWTSLGDTTMRNDRRFGYDPDAGAHNNVKYSELNQKNPDSVGSTSNALKYTGQLNDDLTFTTLYGQLDTKRYTHYDDYDVNGTLYSISSTTGTRQPDLNAQNLYVNHQKFSGNIQKPGDDKVKSFRADLEYKLGDHTLRGGVDHVAISSEGAGVFRAGGGLWTYKKVPAGQEFSEVNLSGARPAIVGNFGGYGVNGYYVQSFQFSSVTSAGSTQSAQYLEDKWQVSKNLLLTVGLRNDQYSNSNGDGVKFIDQKHEVAPRLAASWDVNGNASLKVYGSAGRYYLQLPNQVAARAASRSTYLQQDFTYTGIDPNTGAPTGTRAINTPISADNEYNQAKDPRSVVVKDLKPNFQDEFTLGFEKVYSPDLNLGAKFTYRKEKQGIDDSCDTRPLQKYGDDNKIDYDPGSLPCFIFNPGEAATVWFVGKDGVGRYVTISAKDMGEPHAVRTYEALDFFLEHPMRNGWYGKVNYTWSRNKGNYEGQTRSDTGQTDIATTAAWDFPEFSLNSNGLLPNDRTHQFKAYGVYELNKEWLVGADLLIQSGRPKVCLGTNIDADNGAGNPYGGPGYGPEYFWCNGQPVPRGSIGRMPVEKRLDLNLVYKPGMVKGLEMKVDVFNVFNAQKAVARQEEYDTGDGAIEGTYGEARTLQAPRTVKLSVEYNHKF